MPDNWQGAMLHKCIIRVLYSLVTRHFPCNCMAPLGQTFLTFSFKSLSLQIFTVFYLWLISSGRRSLQLPSA